MFANQELAKKSKLNKSDFIITKSILDLQKFPKDIEKIYFQNKNISDVLTMTIDEALELFKADSLIVRKLSFLQEVGLGYLVLGQKSSSLSGGEAQRVRIANILSKKLGDRCIYVFDTPSRGLHLKDIPILISVFKKIVAKPNTILIADNREELFEKCDYRIEL
jgi:excinuclease ABC subunit A